MKTTMSNSSEKWLFWNWSDRQTDRQDCCRQRFLLLLLRFKPGTWIIRLLFHFSAAFVLRSRLSRLLFITHFCLIGSLKEDYVISIIYIFIFFLLARLHSWPLRWMNRTQSNQPTKLLWSCSTPKCQSNVHRIPTNNVRTDDYDIFSPTQFMRYGSSSLWMIVSNLNNLILSLFFRFISNGSMIADVRFQCGRLTTIHRKMSVFSIPHSFAVKCRMTKLPIEIESELQSEAQKKSVCKNVMKKKLNWNLHFTVDWNAFRGNNNN